VFFLCPVLLTHRTIKHRVFRTPMSLLRNPPWNPTK
jgi:hypothetical protein